MPASDVYRDIADHYLATHNQIQPSPRKEKPMPKLTELRDQLVAVIDAHDASVTRHATRVNQALLTDAGFEEAVAADRDREQWVAKVDAVSAAVEEWVDRAESNVSAARAALEAPQPGSPVEQLLAEQRAVRAWERRKAIMDTQAPVEAHLALLEAVRRTSGDERRVLLEEGPAYLQARDAASPDGEIDRVLAQTDPAYGYAVEYFEAAQKAAGSLVTAASVTREHVLGSRVASARVDLQVRRANLNIELPSPPAGLTTELPGNGRWDPALQEFRPA